MRGWMRALGVYKRQIARQSWKVLNWLRASERFSKNALHLVQCTSNIIFIGGW